MKPLHALLAAASLGTALLFPGLASAQFAKPEDAIKYRQSALSLMGNHMGRIAPVVRGDRPFNAAEVQANVAIIETLSALPWQGFGPGTEGGKAKANIWTDADGFRQNQEKFRAEVAKLSAAAKSGDLAQVRAAFGGVGASCKACHDAFRN